MAPTMTKAELKAAQRIREMDRPPTSVNFSMSVKGQRSRKAQGSLQKMAEMKELNFMST